MSCGSLAKFVSCANDDRTFPRKVSCGVDEGRESMYVTRFIDRLKFANSNFVRKGTHGCGDVPNSGPEGLNTTFDCRTPQKNPFVSSDDEL